MRITRKNLKAQTTEWLKAVNKMLESNVKYWEEVGLDAPVVRRSKQIIGWINETLQSRT